MFDFDVITGPTPPRQDERRGAALSIPDPSLPPQAGREEAPFSPASLEGQGGVAE
jgi:hypothetical protein